MMKLPATTVCLVLSALALALCSSPVAQRFSPAVFAQAAALVAADNPAPAAVLEKYCITCHNEKRKTAGLMIDKLDLQRVGGDAETWEKVARKFRTHEMPPPGASRPDNATYTAVTAHLENALDVAAAAHPNPGRVAVHRLNRAEYANARLEVQQIIERPRRMIGDSLLQLRDVATQQLEDGTSTRSKRICR